MQSIENFRAYFYYYLDPFLGEKFPGTAGLIAVFFFVIENGEAQLKTLYKSSDVT